MGAEKLKSHENEREIFLSCPRLSYVSPKGVNQPLPDPTVPQAYLKYIHYDQDSQFVSMGHMPISDEANEGYQQLLLQLVAQEDGFVQFFVANETLGDVYFDDITGLVRRPKIIQEGHYNPFGLPLAGLTTLGNPEYAYFFTGKELYEDEALQWYDYGARMYDVQIGRWTTHDPVYQDASPYIFCGNNGINYLDPDGRAWGWLDVGLSVVTGGAWAVGKLAYEHTIKGSQFDRWLAENEKEIVQGLFIGASVALAFTPLGPIAGIGVAMAMGGIQGSLYGGGFEGAFRGMVIGGLSAGFGAGAGMAVAGALGKTAASTFGGAMLTAAAGGFAGGFVGGAINAAENGGHIWKGALLGGAIGAGSAVVMAAGVYGVKEGYRKAKFALEKRRLMRSDEKARTVFGKKYDDASIEEKMYLIKKTNMESASKIESRGYKLGVYNETSDTYASTDVTFSGDDILDNSIVKANQGYTIVDPETSTVEIFLNSKASKSWGDWYAAGKHEFTHASWFTKAPWTNQSIHHLLMGISNQYNRNLRQINHTIDHGYNIDFIFR